MPIKPFEKIQHSRDPETEAQRQYYQTELLNEINLCNGNIASWEANISNLKNDIQKAEIEIEKLKKSREFLKAEYKKVRELDFSKPKEEPKVEEEQIVEEPPAEEPEVDELEKIMQEKGLSRDKLLELLKG